MKFLTKNKHWNLIKEYNIDKLLYLSIDRPDRNKNNIFIWKNGKEQFHRDYDLPAYIWSIGYVCWWKNGNKHRDNSRAAKIWNNHYNIDEYWINNKFIKQKIY